jgi:O-antigen/teichoic acid export membrane protein
MVGQHLAKSYVLQVAILTQAAGAVLGLVFTTLAANSLGYEAFGLVGISLVIQYIVFGMDGCNSIARILPRESSKFDLAEQPLRCAALIRLGERAYLILGLVGVTVCVVSAQYFETLLSDNVKSLDASVVKESFQIIALGAFFKLLASYYRGCMIGLEHQNKANLIGFGAVVIRFPGSYVVSLWSEDIRYYLAIQTLAFIGEAIFLKKMIPRVAVLPNDRRLMPWAKSTFLKERRFLLSVLFLSVLGTCASQFDKLILSNTLALSDYGVVSLAIYICSGLLLLATPIHQTFLPKISVLTSHAVSDLYARKMLAILSIVSVTFSGVMAALSKSLAVLTSDAEQVTLEYMSSALYLYGLGNAFLMIGTGCYLIYFSRGELSRYGKLLSIYLLFYSPAIYWAAGAYGTSGAGMIWLLGNAALLAAMIIDLRMKEFISSATVSLLVLNVSMGIVLSLVATLIQSHAPTDWLEAVIALTLSAALIGVLAILLNYRTLWYLDAK